MIKTKSKQPTQSKSSFKENIIIIHGINVGRGTYRIKYYGLLEKELSKKYNVLFFSWNREQTTSELADDLREFITKNKVKSAHFICHSFGSVIFRVFYQKPNCEIRKIIFIAPLVKGAKVLEYSFKKFPVLSEKILGRASVDLLKKRKQSLNFLFQKEYLLLQERKHSNLTR